MNNKNYKEVLVWETIEDTWDIELRANGSVFYLGEVLNLEDALELITILKKKGLIQNSKIVVMDSRVKRAIDGPEY